MKTLLPQKDAPFRLELLRDECRVIESNPGDLGALKKALARNRAHVKVIRAHKANTLAELKKTRESRGRL